MCKYRSIFLHKNWKIDNDALITKQITCQISTEWIEFNSWIVVATNRRRRIAATCTWCAIIIGIETKKLVCIFGCKPTCSNFVQILGIDQAMLQCVPRKWNDLNKTVRPTYLPATRNTRLTQSFVARQKTNTILKWIYFLMLRDVLIEFFGASQVASKCCQLLRRVVYD